MPPGTTAPAPTSAPVRTIARCSTIEPVPTSAPSSIVQPSRCARWPIVQSSPTTVSSSRVQWITAPSCTDVRAPIDDAALVAAQHGLRPDRRPRPDHDVADDRRLRRARTPPGRSAVRSSPRAYSAMALDSNLPTRQWTSQLHVKEVAEQGYTIVEDAIEPDLVDALERRPAAARGVLRRASRRPTRSKGTSTLRVYNLLAYGDALRTRPRARARAAGHRGRARSGLPDLVAVVDRDPARARPRSRSTPTTSSSRCRSRTRRPCATRCGRSPTSPRRTARPASSPARTSGTTPPTTAQHVRLDRGRDAEGLGADLARQPVARRRRERHRRTARRHRDELLRGLHPPAGEPAARPRAARRSTAFEPRLRQLVGYSVYNMLIGHINKHSPEELLLADAPDRGSAMVWDEHLSGWTA